MKQNAINPPPVRGQEMSDEEKKQGASFNYCYACYWYLAAAMGQLQRGM